MRLRSRESTVLAAQGRKRRDPHSLAFHGAEGAFAYEAGGTGPAVSRDGGVSWERAREGDRPALLLVAVAADPADPERLYVSASPGARNGPNGTLFISDTENARVRKVCL
jgi:hypothetical protein